MVIVHVSKPRGPGSSPDRGHCVVFLGRTLYSHSQCLSPPKSAVTLIQGVALQWTSIPSKEGGVEILTPVSSCYRNRNKPRGLMEHVAFVQSLPTLSFTSSFEDTWGKEVSRGRGGAFRKVKKNLCRRCS